MNLIKSTLIATASLVSFTGAVFAQAPAENPAAPAVAQKIVTINMEKIFNDYYKTRSAQVELNKMEKEIQAGNEERMTSIKVIEKDLENLKKKVDDPATKDKEKLVESFNLKRADGIALEKDRQDYVNRKMKALEIHKGTMRNDLVGEINKVVEEKAKEGGYDLVIDNSANSAAGTKVIAYSSSALDMTDIILKEINKDAPAGYDPSQPAPEAAPAPAPAPAAQ